MVYALMDNYFQRLQFPNYFKTSDFWRFTFSSFILRYEYPNCSIDLCKHLKFRTEPKVFFIFTHLKLLYVVTSYTGKLSKQEVR